MISDIKINLFKYRIKNNLTQAQLARQTNLSQSYISELENNRKSPTLRTVKALCNSLRIDPVQLIDIYYK